MATAGFINCTKMLMKLYEEENPQSHRLLKALEAKQADGEDHMTYMIRCKTLFKDANWDGCSKDRVQAMIAIPGSKEERIWKKLMEVK